MECSTIVKVNRKNEFEQSPAGKEGTRGTHEQGHTNKEREHEIIDLIEDAKAHES